MGVSRIMISCAPYGHFAIRIAICFLILFNVFGVHGHLFYTSDGEQRLLNWVNMAEKNLRIFIYPIPNIAMLNELTQVERQRRTMRRVFSHFLSEQLFPDYLKSIQRNSHRYNASDDRRHLIVKDPSKANAFVIDHHWITKYDLYPNCTNFFQQHLHPVINNVVDKYPYHNRSNGRDHFMMAVYDNGAFSTKNPFAPCFHKNIVHPIWNKDIVNRIRNISFITNYARNTVAYSRKHWFDKVLFIPDQDIVIPQMLLPARRLESKRPWLVNRPYDSSFAGRIWGDRHTLRNISTTMDADYCDPRKRTELFFHHFTKSLSPNQRTHSGSNLTEYGYFAYNPCGLGWCWSTRLFDGMLSKTVPVLSGSDIIMPFERFINWRNISVKIDGQSWSNATSDGLTFFRAQLRNEADSFRRGLFQYWDSIGVNHTTERRMQGGICDGKDLDTLKLLQRLQETLLWQKMANIERAMDWFYFDQYVNGPIPQKHPFKLIQLEMWCRVTDYPSRRKLFKHNMSMDLCLRPSAVIAKQRYLS